MAYDLLIKNGRAMMERVPGPSMPTSAYATARLPKSENFDKEWIAGRALCEWIGGCNFPSSSHDRELTELAAEKGVIERRKAERRSACLITAIQ